jgi:hypothetical protein
MKKIMILLLIMSVLSGGCSAMKRSPDATQKMNAYLLKKTADAAAKIACEENADSQLCRLASLASRQSDAVLEYYGGPLQEYEIPIEDLIGEESQKISQAAFENAALASKPVEAVNDFVDIAIGVLGLFGGAAGVKAASFLTNAKIKANALEEIIAGNEQFKKTYPQYSKFFKKAQTNQSQPTKELVTKIKDKA